MLKFKEFVRSFLVTEGYRLMSDDQIEKMDDINILYQSIKKYVQDRGLNIPQPITISGNNVKIIRSLDTPEFVTHIENEFKFTVTDSNKKIKIGRGFMVSFGNGTRTKSGVLKGPEFEDHFSFDLAKWIEEGDEGYNRMFVPEVAREFIEKSNFGEYNPKVEDVLKVGAENNSRPILFSGKQPYIGSLNYLETGKTLSDITISTNPPIYVSCKTTSTVSFFNAGIMRLMPENMIKTGNYSNEVLSLFNMLGIDPIKFSKVFEFIETGKRFSEAVDVSVDSKILNEFIKTGIGGGYWLVHKGYRGKLNSVKYVDSHFVEMASNLKGPITVYYGGKTGEGLRVDIEFNTEIFKFKINLRDKQGKKGYPSHIMMDYQYL
jgi:hypothetical protein